MLAVQARPPIGTRATVTGHGCPVGATFSARVKLGRFADRSVLFCPAFGARDVQQRTDALHPIRRERSPGRPQHLPSPGGTARSERPRHRARRERGRRTLAASCVLSGSRIPVAVWRPKRRRSPLMLGKTNRVSPRNVGRAPGANDFSNHGTPGTPSPSNGVPQYGPANPSHWLT
jgi:hypothetical protein